MLDSLRKKNTVLKDELWAAIQKWHTIEKDLEQQFAKKDTSIDHVQQLKAELDKLNNTKEEAER